MTARWQFLLVGGVVLLSLFQIFLHHDFDIYLSLATLGTHETKASSSTSLSEARGATNSPFDKEDNANRNGAANDSHAVDDDDTIDPFEAHPECALLKQPISVDNALALYGKYVNATHGPLYDHTCFILKPRYNCARNESANVPGDRSWDYALALRDETRTQKMCDLQGFIRDAGGPAGIGRHIQKNYERGQPSNGRNSEFVEVLFMATSRFRQVWESLVCAYTDQISGFLIFKNEKKSNNTLGTSVNRSFVLGGGCHDPSKQGRHEDYFWNKTDVPPNWEYCHDNVAQVEFRFGGRTTIRFSYMFRPWSWKDLALPLGRLGINLHAKHPVNFVFYEDVLPGNGGIQWPYSKRSKDDPLYKKIGPIYEKLFDLRTPANLTVHNQTKKYIEMMKRDLGKVYGPDNPWITNPPDVVHSCMPGGADDKANFILWYMLSLSAIQSS